MLILGIDPGYDRLGIAVIEKKNSGDVLLFSDCLRTSSKQSFSERLLFIGKELEKTFHAWQPDIVVLETLLFSVNQKTALKIAEVRGMIFYLTAKSRLEIAEYNPMQIKSCVAGYGQAKKKQLEKIIPYLLKINKSIKYDDEFDAIAIALTHSAHCRFPKK